MNVAAQQEKNEKTGKKKAGEERKQRLISKRLRAALPRSFRGQHGEKMVCVKGVPVVTGTSGRPTAISTQPKWGQGPHQHVEAA